MLHRPWTLMVIIILLTLILPGICFSGQTDPKDKLLTALEKKYNGRAFSAHFDQTARLSALDLTEKAKGQAWFSHPGKMRWLYLSPDRHEIITNGVDLWLFRPQENQVMTGKAANFFKPGTGSAFLSDISQIRQSFSIALGREDRHFSELILVPKQETPDLSRAVLTIAQPSHEIQMVVTENIYGDTTRFVFTQIRFDDASPDMFTFTIPEGASIIPMD